MGSTGWREVRPGGFRRARRWLPAAAMSLALAVAACGGAGEVAPDPSPQRPADLSGITEEGLRDRLEELVAATGDAPGYRSVGSEGYDRAAALVEQRLAEAGWSVTATTQDGPAVVDGGTSVLEVGGRRFGADDLRPLLLSPAGDVTGRVVAVNGAPGPGARPGVGCDVADYAGLDRGAVVLVPPGGCFRRDQLLAAQQAGAGAFVTYSPAAPAGLVLRPTLARAEGITVPGAWVSADAAAALGAAAAEGGDARLVLTARTEQRPTHSVVGEITGSGDRVVMLGAHLDSVVDGPGANDDGSGVAALLEIARWLGSGQREATVRLAFWSAEEVGLLGSSRYVDALSAEERAAVAVYVNADMLGSPNGFAGVYDEAGAAPGSAVAHDLLQEAVERAGGTPVPVDLQGSSDHYPFTLAGIATAGVFSGAVERVTDAQARASGATAGEPADACYHQACDDLDNVDLALTRLLTAAVADFTLLVADDPGRLTAVDGSS